MKKLLKKQGFTLVELIVVIAIMAIMLAMVIPALTTRTSFEQEARELARAFYSNVQELMIDEKLNGTKLNDNTGTGNSAYTLVYAEIVMPSDNTVASIAKLELRFFSGVSEIGTTTATIELTPEADYSFDTSADFGEFANSLHKLLGSNENDGYYYAVVDSKYRVVYAYYSRYADIDDMIGAGTFSGDYQITDTDGNAQYVGAYPFTEFDKGDDVFPDPATVD